MATNIETTPRDNQQPHPPQRRQISILDTVGGTETDRGFLLLLLLKMRKPGCQRKKKSVAQLHGETFRWSWARPAGDGGGLLHQNRTRTRKQQGSSGAWVLPLGTFQNKTYRNTVSPLWKALSFCPVLETRVFGPTSRSYQYQARLSNEMHVSS